MYGAPIGGEWGGLFSDLVRVPWADTMLVPLPPGRDPIAMASASDNWSLAWRLVAPHLQRTPGARVLILGGGSIGLYACDIAGALGASDRLYVDRDHQRRAMYLNSMNLRIARDNVCANIPPALHLAQSGRVDPMKVVSDVLEWETLPDALPEMHTKPVFVREPVRLPQIETSAAASA